MRKLRFSEAGCDENRTPRFHREVRSVIAPIDSTLSLRETAKRTGVAVNTVKKVKALLEQTNSS